MADWQLLQQQRGELLDENTKLLHKLAREHGVEPESIGADRPGAVRQDLMLSEVYDLTDMNTLLKSILGKHEGGEDTVTVIEDLPGVGAELAQKLKGSGFDEPAKIAASSVEELTAIQGVGEKKARELQEAAGGKGRA